VAVRIWTSIVAGLLVLGLTGVGQAKNKADKPAKAKEHRKGAEGKKHHAVAGTVESVAPDGKSFVLHKKGKRGGTVTETLADSTRIGVKTHKHAKAGPGALADIKPGKHVRVMPGTGTARKVIVRELAKARKAEGHHKHGKAHKKA
jgi:hypothetical protein